MMRTARRDAAECWLGCETIRVGFTHVENILIKSVLPCRRAAEQLGSPLGPDNSLEFCYTFEGCVPAWLWH